MLLKQLISHDSNLSEVSIKENIDIKSVGLSLDSSSLIYLRDVKYTKQFLDEYKAGHGDGSKDKNYDPLKMAIIASSKVLSDYEAELSEFAAVIESKNVNLSMSLLSKPLFEEHRESWLDVVDGRQMETAKIHPSAEIAQHVFIGANVEIGKNVFIHSGARILSNSVIGEGSIIHPNVVIYPESQLGQNVVIHAGSVIGSDGFGYNFDNGVHHKVYHIGNVIIEDDVEIGSNCSVDRATFGSTIIGAGSKLDNFVQIAHNCKLGKGAILCGRSGMAGSSSIGDYVVMGGFAAITDGVSVADQVQIAGMSGVTTSWDKPGEKIGGFPARPLKEWLKSMAAVNKLIKK